MTRPIELADHVFQLSVQPGINCWAVVEPQGTTLIDTGLNQRGLVRALRRLGVLPTDVHTVLLTHGHPDHTGGIAQLRRAGGTGHVRVGAEDLATVRGLEPQRPSDTASLGGRIFNRLPPAPGFGPAPPVLDATALLPGEQLDVAGGIDVVATPGHTPGHVAFHLRAHDLVLGGDVVFNVFTLRPAPTFLCWQAEPNRRSITTIADLAPATLALAHGRPVRGDVAGRLHELVGVVPA